MKFVYTRDGYTIKCYNDQERAAIAHQRAINFNRAQAALKSFSTDVAQDDPNRQDLLNRVIKRWVLAERLCKREITPDLSTFVGPDGVIRHNPCDPGDWMEYKLWYMLAGINAHNAGLVADEEAAKRRARVARFAAERWPSEHNSDMARYYGHAAADASYNRLMSWAELSPMYWGV